MQINAAEKTRAGQDKPAGKKIEDEQHMNTRSPSTRRSEYGRVSRPALVALSVLFCVAIAALFLAKLPGPQQRQSLDEEAMRYKQSIASAYQAVEKAAATGIARPDYCETAAASGRALALLHSARDACRKYFPEGSIMTSDDTLERVARMKSSAEQRCQRQRAIKTGSKP